MRWMTPIYVWSFVHTMTRHGILIYSFLLLCCVGPKHHSNVCFKWGRGSSRQIFDAAWRTGKSVGVIGTLTTVPAAFANFVMLWSRFELGWFYPLIAIHIFNAFMSFMLLIGLRSKLCSVQNCVLARAGYVAIIAGFLWLLAAILLYLVRRKEAEMASKPNGVDLKDIENDGEVLALPAPEKHLTLPAPDDDDDDKRKNNKKTTSSREVPLALPPSESAREESSKWKGSARKSQPLSSSNRTSTTAPESPRPMAPSRRSNSSRSPRKSSRAAAMDQEKSPTPRNSPRKSDPPTAPNSPGPLSSSRRSNSSKSPRKGRRASVSGGEGLPSTPRKSSTNSPKKKGSATTPSSSGSKRKKARPATRPNDIPEI